MRRQLSCGPTPPIVVGASTHPNTRCGPHHHLPSLITSPSRLIQSSFPPLTAVLSSVGPPNASSLPVARHTATNARVTKYTTIVPLHLPAGSTANAREASVPAKNAGKPADGLRLNPGTKTRYKVLYAME